MTTTQLTAAASKAIRSAVRGQTKTISKGWSSHTAGAGTGTPIRLVEGNQAPQLVGQPYLKTTFSNGRGFTKTLYTPSTLAIIVGADWLSA